MKHGSGVLLLGIMIGGCARPQAAPRLAPTALTRSTPVQSAPVDSAPRKSALSDSISPANPASALAPPHDSAATNGVVAFDRKVADDSLADAAALAALSNASALNSMPELPIGDTPSLELNEASFAEQPRVQFYVDYFTGNSRDRFQVWLQRLPQYEGLIRTRMADNKLPGDLIYLALIESGYSPNAVSTASAVGMWQFMVGTGMKYGLRVDGWVDERRDPVKSTDAAARLLRDLTDQFGSYYLAAAAYNAGSGKVERGLTRLTGAPSAAPSEEDPDLTSGDAFFSLANTRMLMQETKDYVPKLIAATLISKAPQKYGFEPVEAVPPFSLDSVMVDGGTGLDLIARLADTTLDAMRELNPHLLRLVAPPGTPSYPVRVPAGTAETVAALYADIPPADRLALTTYMARDGETVTSIAAKTGVSAEALRTVNRVARVGKITSGTLLYIPHTSIPLSLLRDAGSSTLMLTHVVKSGENLGGIARKYGVTVAAIRSSNGLGLKSMIRVGQKLSVPSALIPGPASTAPRSSVASSSTPRSSKSVAAASSTVDAKPMGPNASASIRTHIVRSGETLSGIAALYGVNQERLLAINGLTASRKISVGQKLKIPA